jgi:hypothetical protein
MEMLGRQTCFLRRSTMEQDTYITVEERARITAIQDLLIDRYVEQKEAIQEGNRCRAIQLEFEIKELLREKKKIKEWAAA